MKITTEDATLVDVGDLKHFSKNARLGNVEVIMESLEVNGQYRPIVVNRKTMEVLAGNHTLKAARELGWPQVAVNFVNVTDEQADKIAAVDNRANDLAVYDNLALATLLSGMDTLEGTGFDSDALDQLLDSLDMAEPDKEDRTPPVPAKPKTALGDVYQLGDHRLICGNARDPEVLSTLLEDELAAMVMTSPPYNQQIDSFKASGMRKGGSNWVDRMADAYSDSQPEPEYQDEQVELLNLLLDYTTENASIFYNHKNRLRDKVQVTPYQWILRSEWQVRQEVTWARGGAIALNARCFMPNDEKIFWLTKPGADFLFNDTAEVKAFGTVWSIAPKAEIQLSAPFPVELPRRCILASSRRGDIVLEPYAGSGTVMVAAEQTQRRAFMVEINPAYCDVIVERWETLTGDTAEMVTP